MPTHRLQTVVDFLNLEASSFAHIFSGLRESRLVEVLCEGARDDGKFEALKYEKMSVLEGFETL